MEDFESILQQQQFDGGTATGVLDHEWVTSFLHMSFIHSAEDWPPVKTMHTVNSMPMNVTRSFMK